MKTVLNVVLVFSCFAAIFCFAGVIISALSREWLLMIVGCFLSAINARCIFWVHDALKQY